jgi:hypothetical protein
MEPLPHFTPSQGYQKHVLPACACEGRSNMNSGRCYYYSVWDMIWVWMRQSEEEEEARQRYNELLEHMRRVFSLLSMIWQKLLDTLLFFCNFSGFPHKYRPPCTTMPWNIWPALVVLWGVCWMFWNPVHPICDAESRAVETGKTLSHHLYVPSSATNDFHVDTSNVFTRQHQPQNSLFSDELP